MSTTAQSWSWEQLAAGIVDRAANIYLAKQQIDLASRIQGAPDMQWYTLGTVQLNEPATHGGAPYDPKLGTSQALAGGGGMDPAMLLALGAGALALVMLVR